jgi:hypothetical protein
MLVPFTPNECDVSCPILLPIQPTLHVPCSALSPTRIPHFSFLIPHYSFLITHYSFLIPRPASLIPIPHPASLIPHSSFLITHYHPPSRIYSPRSAGLLQSSRYGYGADQSTFPSLSRRRINGWPLVPSPSPTTVRIVPTASIRNRRGSPCPVMSNTTRGRCSLS